MRVFWQRGYDKTSVDDLEAETGVGRKSLYRVFQDKPALFLAALRQYRQLMSKEVLAPLRRPKAGLAEVEGLLMTLCRRAETPEGRMGCLICNTALEWGSAWPEASEQVEGYWRDLQQALRSALRQDRLGSRLTEPELQREANFLLAVVQSLCVMARSGARPEVLQDVVHTALLRLR